MLRRNSGGNIGTTLKYKIHCIAGRYMLKNHAKLGKILNDAAQMAFDELRFPVKDIDIVRRHFAVNAKNNTFSFHTRENRSQLCDIGNTMRGIGRSVGRVKLRCCKHPIRRASRQVIGIRGVR